MILVCDDDLFLARSLGRLLTSHKFAVETVHSVADAWKTIQAFPPELLVLDLSLPDGDGTELCSRIRTKYDFPILMLTSRGDSIDKVTGLGLGADDYLTKPFDPHELVARIQALMRRAAPRTPQVVSNLTLGDLVIDQAQHEVRVRAVALSLTETEYSLLHYLVQNAQRSVSRDEIYRAVWGYAAGEGSNSLDVLIYRVRTKLSQAGSGQTIATIRGFGYRMRDRA